MENLTPTPAQENVVAPETPQATDNTPVAPETPQAPEGKPAPLDTSAALAAIRAQKNGQPAVLPTEAETQPGTDKPPVTEETPGTPFTPEQFLKETSKGLVESPEDFGKLVAEYQAMKENPYSGLSEQEQQLLAVFRSHENPQEYFEFQQKDYVGMSAVEVLRENFLAQNTDMDRALLDRAFERELYNKYPHLDAADEEDTDYLLDKKLMEKEASRLRNELIKKQEDSRVSLKQQAPNEPSEADQQKYQDYLDSAKNSLAGFNEIKIQVDPNGSEITVGVEGKEKLEQAMANPLAYLETHLTKDGEWDINKLQRIFHNIENEAYMHRSIYLAGKQAGEAALIDNKLKNPTPLQPSNQPGNGVDRQAVVAAIRQNNQKSTSHI
jgi:hypothetical protein